MSTLDRQVKGTNKWEKYKRKTPFSFCTSERKYLKTEGLKVRLSEQNPKRNTKFLFGFSNGSTLGRQVRGTIKWVKNQINLCFSEREYAKSSKYHKFLLAFYGIFKNYRIFIIPNLGVLYILQNTETSRVRLVSRLLPVLFRQTPNFLIFNQSPN